MMSHPTSTSTTYSSRQAASLSGLTLRQIQTWDESGIVRPKHVKHARQYSDEQIQRLKILAQLRKIGVSPKRAVAMLRGQRKAWLVMREGQSITIRPFRMSRAGQGAA